MAGFLLFSIALIFLISMISLRQERISAKPSDLAFVLLFVAPLALIVSALALIESPSPLVALALIVSLVATISATTWRMVYQTMVVSAAVFPLALIAATASWL